MNPLQKYFQKSHMKVHMMSHRSNESQYKLSFHLSDAKTFWKIYSLTEFSRKSYLCCGRYLVEYSLGVYLDSVDSTHLDLGFQNNIACDRIIWIMSKVYNVYESP